MKAYMIRLVFVLLTVLPSASKLEAQTTGGFAGRLVSKCFAVIAKAFPVRPLQTPESVLKANDYVDELLMGSESIGASGVFESSDLAQVLHRPLPGELLKELSALSPEEIRDLDINFVQILRSSLPFGVRPETVESLVELNQILETARVFQLEDRVGMQVDSSDLRRISIGPEQIQAARILQSWDESRRLYPD
jgi:hypothetical protein